MFRIDELIVYREYEQDQDQVLNDMAFIVEETETMGMPVSDLRGLYFSCIHKLTELAGTYGFEGNLWHSYLTWLLVNNENVLQSCKRDPRRRWMAASMHWWSMIMRFFVNYMP